VTSDSLPSSSGSSEGSSDGVYRRVGGHDRMRGMRRKREEGEEGFTVSVDDPVGAR
jgi:hypothetical protein